MKSKSRKRRLSDKPVSVTIEDLDRDGQGVSAVEGKRVRVRGALPGERVRARIVNRRRGCSEAIVDEVLEASPDRVTPLCPHYGVCGGCSLQHLASEGQLALKQRMLLEALREIGNVQAESLLPALKNETPWGYRRKARLGVKDVAKKGRVLVGFREYGSPYVADLNSCVVLHPAISKLLSPLARLIERMAIRRCVPQIEVAMDDSDVALIFRILEPLGTDDRQRLTEFAAALDVWVLLQSAGPGSIESLGPERPLHYTLPAHDIKLGFRPEHFTQVNTEINRLMVDRIIDLLQPRIDDRVLDLFCGVGNFTLPLARYAGALIGVEGDAGLVQRARQNARENDLRNVDFHVANLYQELDGASWVGEHFDKVLLDPPRSGALEVLDILPRVGARRLLYVSCFPETLARDTKVLVHRHGYRLKGTGVMDMFPHTSHVESLAWFEKE